ncbi:hypothetical protein K5P26_09465 [Sphingopyxis sp. XHP0097]|uniref:DUF2007 domain-containing protein n=1 Tax=Sphingopyxis jiangsuensis TaxID=2871171 RepID=A0ABS7MEB9_9SPHN|nr:MULTISPECIES: hypothetical protein [Sphingopyxis]MBL0769527.1 hypothetical protein [Sphingopyxis lutea]MBY4637365.1 hypothetical protein [Sphingopyxis jiangsuensis]
MSDDAMVPVALIFGRGEALSVAAMLDAAGIIVHVGGEHYTSVTAHIIAVGGFRLTVPVWQHAEAVAVLTELVAMPEPEPSPDRHRALRRLLKGILIASSVTMAPFVAIHGVKILLAILLSPLIMLQIPVDPRVRGEYFLASDRA